MFDRRKPSASASLADVMASGVLHVLGWMIYLLLCRLFHLVLTSKGEWKVQLSFVTRVDDRV